MATIEIDGKSVTVENGKMIIEVADELGIYIPRFCYHKKLSVAANCRMCLVEVENNRKTVPACATPINDGMKVFTKSPAAVRSQQAVMDFLLINHPLDCPICDQGGECELQDLSMGYGHDSSTYDSTKRAVADEDIGPLVATEMTRCIQCTRCVRFGEEIAGVPELGRLGRGENMQIGTFVKHSMTSEVSANIIDLCPVGALTSKPFRFQARAWEMTQHESVAPHDCLGSNVYLHVRRNELMRVVPRENENINEIWLSDRDRFSYLGLKSQHRAKTPMIKRDGQWHEVDWESALTFAAQGINRVLNQHGPEQWATFASASSTLEEFYLLQKLMRSLGVQNIDHRLQQIDYRDQAMQPMMPKSTLAFADLEHQSNIIIIGCNVHREVPLVGVKIRKASLNGASIYSVNPVNFDFHFTVTGRTLAAPQDMPLQLATLLAAVVQDEQHLPSEIKKLILGLSPDEGSKALALALRQTGAVIVTGALVEHHPDAALLRTLVELITRYTGAKTLKITSGANAAGAWLAGMLPHRSVAGKVVDNPGLDTQDALNAKLKGYFLMGVDPGYDFANPHVARQSMLGAEFVVVMSAFQSDATLEYANVILPMAPYAETSGTYINVDQTWQTVKGAVAPAGESRPAWKILRVLANILHCDDFDYTSSEDVLNEIKSCADMHHDGGAALFYPETLPVNQSHLVRLGEWPLYRCDSIVRHANELQQCAASDQAMIRMNPATIAHYNLSDTATISQGDIEITLPLQSDDRIAPDVVWIPNAMPETVDLGHAFAPIVIK